MNNLIWNAKFVWFASYSLAVKRRRLCPHDGVYGQELAGSETEIPRDFFRSQSRRAANFKLYRNKKILCPFNNQAVMLGYI